MQIKILSCTDVSFVFYECQDIDKNDKSLLIDRPVAPRSDKYVSLDLTLIGCIEILAGTHLKS